MSPDTRTKLEINRAFVETLRRRTDPRRLRACFVSILILFGILGLGNVAKAYGSSQEVELVLHGVCKHFSSHQKNGQPWNEQNPGIALRLPLNRTGSLALQGGTYENSYSLRSLYIGVDWLPIQRGAFGIGAGIGTATGYQAFGGAPVPIGNLTMQWKASDRLTIRMRMLPPVHPKMTGVAALEIGLRLPRFGTVMH